MTDQQIVDFIVGRAKRNGRAFKLEDPKLMLRFYHGNKVLLAIKYANHHLPFIVRFVQGPLRGVFKLNAHDPQIASWISKATIGKVLPFEIDYRFDALPDCIKHFVSYSIIQALQTNGMGFDMFSINYPKDIDLVKPNETYEEAAIESDLMGIMDY